MNQIEPDRTELQPLINRKPRKWPRKKLFKEKETYQENLDHVNYSKSLYLFNLFIHRTNYRFFIRSHDMFARKSDTIDKQIRVHVEVVRFACFLSEHLISKKTSFTDNFAKSSFFWSFSTLSNSIDITWLTWPKLYKDYLIIKINYYSNIK